ncbi:BspA family leucine-rich repeat surface protein [Lapidilactobacillus wuchangensis]|uniref:BspA family leucine-rich repeat surface protein n=1 Tax=Lapidilactobacillus wuchangensis TaxID=2486001 RepID=UPI0013DDB88B|nr:BspA family leucine-rich repeat surface protein [Lapidilactobacillus wuchangensis]
MNTKVRFKMYKAGKRWMVMGIATATLALVPGGLAQAATNTGSDANAVVTNPQTKQATPVTEVATTIVASGQLGTAADAAKWDLNDQGTLTIHAGVLHRSQPGAFYWKQSASKIKTIVFEPTVTVAAGDGDLDKYFDDLPNLTTVQGASNFDVANVTNMEQLFWDDTSLTSIDVANWDVSQVTSMRQMFKNDGALTSLDVANWNTASLNSLDGTFESTGITNLAVANWNTSHVTALDNTFEDMPITQIDVSKWDTSNVEDFGYLFAYDTALEQVDVSHFDTSKSAYFWGMFLDDASLTSLDLSNFDTSAGTLNDDALAGLSSLEKITIGPKVVNFAATNLGDPAANASDPNNANTGKWQTVEPSLGGTEADPKGSTMTGAQIVSTPVTTATTYVAQKKVTATIRFVDSQGNELFPATTVTGVAGAQLPAITIPAKANYHVVSDGTQNASFVAAQNNVYDVVYGDDVATSTETKQVNRTINYVVKGGLVKAPAARQQTVNFTRTKTTDLVDGAVSYSDWQADGTFAAVTSPVVAGYQADPAEITAATPQATDQDSTLTVTYQVVGGQTTTTTPTNTGKTESTSTTTSELTTGILLPKTGRALKPTVAKTVQSATTANSSEPTTLPTLNNEAAGVLLPKTNEKKQGTFLTIAGLALVGFLAIALTPKKKHI